VFDFLIDSMMMPILDFFHQISSSYGTAIILLTCVVRLAIFPLSAKQYASMRAMQLLQPKLKALQERYRDKPQELNQAMMAFYQEHKVNPFGGCLPLLIQMPFLIALYSTLVSTKFTERVGHQGYGLIDDLTRSGFYSSWHAPLVTDWGFGQALSSGYMYWDNLMMVVLFGVTTFITQKVMMTDPDDPMQQQMLYMMPLMITVMFVLLPLPSGVLLYTVFSNFFTLGQYLVLKEMYPSLAPVPAAESPKQELAVQPVVVKKKVVGSKATKKRR
jgi:YidC/Oxa1 family membrane protein insertase